MTYRFVPYGGGVEALDRFAVRDRIRGGEIEALLIIIPFIGWLASLASAASHLLGYAVYRHAPELGWE